MRQEILAPEEIYADLESRRAEAELAQLRTDRRENYKLLRRLRPITDPHSVGALNFSAVLGGYSALQQILKFQQWCAVENGEIQVRDSSKIAEDIYGYAVVRPTDIKDRDFFLRVGEGLVHSVIIMPRLEGPLPRQGKIKDGIIEQMQMVSGQQINDYSIWLRRMNDAK